MAAVMLLSCSKQLNEQVTDNSKPEDSTTVVFVFIPSPTMEPFSAPTRTVTISDVSTRLDVWISDGETTTAIHQTSTDDHFGSFVLTLDKTKTYTLYAVGHKADGQATLADGIVSWPDDKIKDILWYTTTFSAVTTSQLPCQMSRIAAMFRIETTDAIPASAKKMRITQAGVYDRWNVSTGATHQIDRISTITIGSTNNDGTAAFSVYSIVSDEETTHTVTIDALDADDNVIQTKIFTDVPLRNGYKTTYRGAVFTDSDVSVSFTVPDWQSYDVVNF